MTEQTTWDGKPVSPEPPFGASILVTRRGTGGIKFLLLHRAHEGTDYEGDWAWTPPSGARQPGEDLTASARRELLEETGLTLEITPTEFGTTDWPVFIAEAQPDCAVTLSAEHDRYEWLRAEEAIQLCQPAEVAAPIALANQSNLAE
ncbi:MAG: NUDIX domain-containing protein [Anaerolineae bacterium]|nr:MAG: NUDIX domain-containing protein [Anaerolineae bacterium]